MTTLRSALTSWRQVSLLNILHFKMQNCNFLLYNSICSLQKQQLWFIRCRLHTRIAKQSAFWRCSSVPVTTRIAKIPYDAGYVSTASDNSSSSLALAVPSCDSYVWVFNPHVILSWRHVTWLYDGVNHVRSLLVDRNRISATPQVFIGMALFACFSWYTQNVGLFLRWS